MFNSGLRLNFVTPLPPLPTEIANHSALVVAALGQLGEVTVWTDQRQWLPQTGATVMRLESHNLPVATLATAPVFYNIGNNPTFHSTIWEASRRVPGIVILHDTCLQNLFCGLCATPAGFGDYSAMMARFHGRHGEADVRRLALGTADIRTLMEAYPLTQAAVEGSCGVIVHNEAELPRIRQMTQAPVRYVPLATACHDDLVRRCAPGRPKRLIAFGHIGINRRVELAVEVLARRHLRALYHFDVFGTLQDEAGLRDLIARHGMDDHVTLHGHVPAGELDEALATADMALNLRNPTMGEASASQLRIWANGLPSVVSRAGWYATLPEELVNFVDPANEAADLDRLLGEFASAPEPFIARGAAGVAHVRATHRADAYAAELADMAVETSRPRMVAVPRTVVPLTGPGIVGNVEAVGDVWIVGWAAMPGEGERLAVRLFAGTTLVAEAVADEFRADVKRAGVGDGFCGFILRQPRYRFDDPDEIVSIVAVGSRAEMVLLQGQADAIGIKWAAEPPLPLFYLHVTDLLIFGLHSSTISGIQRVQLGLIANWLANAQRGARVRFVVFSAEAATLHVCDNEDVHWLIDSFSLKDCDYATRQDRLRTILDTMSAAKPFMPDHGDLLVLTGNFWSFPGLQPALRHLRQATGLRCIQLFYDAVPALVPETCPANSIVDYNRALVHMLDQTDAVFAISHSCAGELRWLAARLGLPCPPIEVMPMGTEVRYDEQDEHGDLPPGLGDFVLCVGTIEPRKNHLYLFNLWRRLVRRLGRPTPQLVCVGRFGWMTESLQANLRATNNLDGMFVTLADVSDATLRALYKACRFTIYPSIYEGWGLPVSESLSAGRLCVTSNVTSMPEAGGRWAVYVDPYDLSSGFDTVAELIDNPDLVRAREAEIAATYRPTTWAQAATAMWEGLERLVETAGLAQSRSFDPPVLLPGEHHAMAILPPAQGPVPVARREIGSLVFGRVLFGPNWHPVEDWGAWARGPVARLLLHADSGDDEVVAYIQIGLPIGSRPNACTVTVDGEAVGMSAVGPGLGIVRVPLGGGGRKRIDLSLTDEVVALGDHRQLGLGLLRVHLFRAQDVQERLAFMEAYA